MHGQPRKSSATSDVGAETANSFGDRSLALRRAGELLNQQIWCWGRDILSPYGNLLTQFGFRRHEKPAGSSAASLYRLDVSPTARVILRGFGVFYGDDRRGGVFLPRFGFSPYPTPGPDLPAPIWTADESPPRGRPSANSPRISRRLLLDLIAWIVEYENWVLDSRSLAYRRDCVAGWKQAKCRPIPAEQMATCWRLVRARIGRHAEWFLPSVPGLERRQA